MDIKNYVFLWNPIKILNKDYKKYKNKYFLNINQI